MGANSVAGGSVVLLSAAEVLFVAIVRGVHQLYAPRPVLAAAVAVLAVAVVVLAVVVVLAAAVLAVVLAVVFAVVFAAVVLAAVAVVLFADFVVLAAAAVAGVTVGPIHSAPHPHCLRCWHL